MELLRRRGFLVYVVTFIIIAGVVILLFLRTHSIRSTAVRLPCAENITSLAKALLIYSENYDGKFPTADKWCDLLVEYGGVPKKMFICPYGKEAESHYALNPNAEPNSPGDVVLLFETTGGWNQFGGVELISAENHNGDGANVAFVQDGPAFVRPIYFGKLNWGTKRR